MSENQMHAWQVLNNLGFEELFDDKCMPLVQDFLDNLAATPANIVQLRGQRFATCQQNGK